MKLRKRIRVAYGEPKKDPRERCESYSCRRIVNATSNLCAGCRRVICVPCALAKGHHANGEHR